MATEEALREQAVILFEQGEKVSSISRKLGRSREWVYKWVKRSAGGSEEWNQSKSRAPHKSPTKTSDTLEQAVVNTRKRLEESPYSEWGAYAIWHDMRRRGLPAPSVATINRILSAHGLIKKRTPYQKSGIEYPDVPLNTHIMDLVGPSYLRGGNRFYLLNVICNEARVAGVYPIPTKSGTDVTKSVVAFWKSYSKPDFLQMDNELSFKGSNRHPRGLGLLIRTALSLNVTPRFIPVGEPWRNGVIERFNQKVEKTLLMQQHASFDELVRHAQEFTMEHNQSHHYSTMGHKTPLQLVNELDLPVVPLSADYQVKERPKLEESNLNEIQFIRLVRSDLSINVLNTEIKVIPELMHTYVEALLLVNEHQLQIRQDNKLFQTVEFVMPTE